MKSFIILFSLLPFILNARNHPESYYQEIAENFFHGTETRLEDGTRCDILTDRFAIEVDFANKWTEAVGQSLHYALVSGRKAVAFLILEEPEDERFVERAKAVRDANNLNMDIVVLEYWEGHFFLQHFVQCD